MGVKTHQTLMAPAISRNHPSAARPRLRRTLLSIRPTIGKRPRLSSAFCEWYRFTWLGSDVFGLRPDEAVVRNLLEHVGRPAGCARNRERGREELLGQADRLQDDRPIELHVGRRGPF